MDKFFKKWFNGSLRHKILLVLSLCMITPLFILSIINYKVTLGTLEKNVNNLSRQDAEKLSYYFYREMIDFFNLAYFCSQDTDIVKALSATKTPGYLDTAYNLINHRIINSEIAKRARYPFEYTFVLTDGRIITKYSYSDGTNYHEVSDNLKKEQWFKELMSLNIYATRVFAHNDYVSDLSGDMIYFARNIIDDSQNIGVVLVGFSKYHISRLLANSTISPDSSIYVLDNNGVCIAEGEDNPLEFSSISSGDMISAFQGSSSSDGRRYMTIAGKKQIINGYKFPMTDLSDRMWYVMMLTPLNTVMKDVTYIKYVTAFLILLCLVALFVLVLLVEKYILNPIININSLMKKVRQGDTLVHSDVKGEDEIGQLSAGFNDMTHELHLYIENIHREEKEKRDLELRMLQSQINPHFVRNTLNVIRWMAELRRAEGISRALLSFIRLVDYNISGNSVYVSLKDEISNIEEYINIQKLRYGNRFMGTIEIHEGVMECKLLKLSIQPIVENCIIHGFQNISWHGEIKITGIKRDDKLIITVSDNGRGMDSKTAGVILCEENLPNKHDRFGSIGLANVNRRIKLNFGEEFGLSIESEENKGTTVTMVLPCLTGDEGAY